MMTDMASPKTVTVSRNSSIVRKSEGSSSSMDGIARGNSGESFFFACFFLHKATNLDEFVICFTLFLPVSSQLMNFDI